MTIDEFVLRFRDLSRCSDFSPQLRFYARHLFICLALDLPSAVEARSTLLSETQHESLRNCGPNVPPLFEARLKSRLGPIPLSDYCADDALDQLLRVVQELVAEFVLANNPPSYKVCPPFCLCGCNDANRSFPEERQPFFRYVDIDTFEKHILFPGRAGKLPVTLGSRRQFYSEARVKKMSSAPYLFDIDRDGIISLGKPPELLNGTQVQSVIFLVPEQSAPHRTSCDAKNIASRLGLPSLLTSSDGDLRRNQGFAVLRLFPDEFDPLYRPSILDALSHLAFRPGPSDDGSYPIFRHGWTRVFKGGELLSDTPSIVDELGCKEVVMPSRYERFPSGSFQLETVCFFEL